MRFAEDDSAGGYRIRAYAAGQITVNDEVITDSLVISSTQLLRDWLPQRFEDLQAEHLQGLIELRPEIVLLGTGAQLRFPAPAMIAALQQQGIGIEVMDTASACRTYNVLVSESRQVIAALLMI